MIDCGNAILRKLIYVYPAINGVSVNQHKIKSARIQFLRLLHFIVLDYTSVFHEQIIITACRSGIGRMS